VLGAQRGTSFDSCPGQKFGGLTRDFMANKNRTKRELRGRGFNRKMPKESVLAGRDGVDGS